jgi:ribosomal-protein-alanine N-acetyltransferase
MNDMAEANSEAGRLDAVEREMNLQRLMLRQPMRSDATAMFDGWTQDPLVTRYLIWSPHRSIEDTEAYLAFVDRCWTDGSEFTWLICLKPSGQPIGTISLTDGGFKAGLGFAIARAHWSCGYVREAGSHILALGFGHLGLHRIGGYCDVENTGSMRVMEKMGFSREGKLRNWLVHPTIAKTPRDCFSYAITRDEWVVGCNNRPGRA